MASQYQRLGGKYPGTEKCFFVIGVVIQEFEKYEENSAYNRVG